MKNKMFLIVAESSYFSGRLHCFLERYCNAATVIDVCRKDNLADIIQRTRPSIVFMETKFYFEGTPFLVCDCLHRHRGLNVVMWTVEELPPGCAGRFISLGARSFIDFRRPLEETRAALLSVIRGDDYITDVIRKSADGFPVPDFENGTLRLPEIIIIRLVVFGKSMKEVADVVGLAPQTVRVYLMRIYAKCAVRDRESLILFALQTNIVTPREFCRARMKSYEKPLKDIRAAEKQKNCKERKNGDTV
jgi:DNA-binding NarL/FixJ family response regulator